MTSVSPYLVSIYQSVRAGEIFDVDIGSSTTWLKVLEFRPQISPSTSDLHSRAFRSANSLPEYGGGERATSLAGSQ